MLLDQTRDLLQTMPQRLSPGEHANQLDQRRLRLHPPGLNGWARIQRRSLLYTSKALRAMDVPSRTGILDATFQGFRGGSRCGRSRPGRRLGKSSATAEYLAV